jgi:Arc/MetJ-type ribon-helix-helix transcriptional regulator
VKETQKVQLDPEDLEFIDRVYKSPHYASKSEYMREAVQQKIRVDKRKLREVQRHEAMKGYLRQDAALFESLAAEPFENR